MLRSGDPVHELCRSHQLFVNNSLGMVSASSMENDALIADALRSASHTRLLLVRPGVRHEVAAAFRSQFEGQQPIVVADQNTFAAAGRDVYDSFQRAGVGMVVPFVFGPHINADDRCVIELRQTLESSAAIPIAVGSGTINDVTKLAAHQTNRPYLALATAASMDGYTAYGASIMSQGSKQTFDCPAPQAVLADLEVIAAAPPGMNASGFADLVAKVPAGAVWIVADALGIEPIDRSVWQTVQQRLKKWVHEPSAVARGEPAALRHLITGLMMTGFAMQAARTSRPASGAEHQFSHLWDMQHHTHNGAAPSHGFKVGIGSLASIALYEELLNHDVTTLDVENVLAAWPSVDAACQEISNKFADEQLKRVASTETRAKYPSHEQLGIQLRTLQQAWPDLREKLKAQLIPFDQVQARLRDAGCPTQPEQIGISRQRLRQSYRQALAIRRRFTVLDLAERTGLLEHALERIFGPGGRWS